MNTRKFDSLAERIANGWAETIPDFIPFSSIPVSETSQYQFYAFLRGVADNVRDHPDWLDLPIQADDGYEPGELKNHRPKLIKAMLRTKRKLDDFITLLLRIGLYGSVHGQALCIRKEEINLTTKTGTRLAHFGLALEPGNEETVITCNAFPDMFPAWVWLATETTRTEPTPWQKSVPPVLFSHCLYSDTYPYAKDVLIRLADDSPGLPRLVEFLEKEGYSLVSNRANRLTADWVKTYGKSDEPLKDSWAERTHGGLSIEYDWIRKNPLFYGLRIPEFKTLLQHFDAMPDPTKDFVVHHTKHCDACGYCTQTDKTGKRPRASKTVEYNGKYALCPLFPGFSYTWQKLDEAVVKNIQTFLTFVDDSLTREPKQ